MVAATIPIFPLGRPLVPGAPLVLRIFEPRYLELIDDLRERPVGQRAFGVVLIERGLEVGDRPVQLTDTGCLAEIGQVKVLTRQPWLQLAVQAVGTRRFRVGEVDLTSHPYARAVVTWLADELPDAADLEREGASLVAEHAAYRRRLGRDEVCFKGSADTFAWQAVEHTVLAPADVQGLLVVDDPVRRTRHMRSLLRRESVLGQRFSSIPHVEGPAGASLN